MSYLDFAPQRQYTDNEWVYSALYNDSSLFIGDTVLHKFYDSVQMTNMGTLYTIRQNILQGNNMAAQSMNTALMPLNTIELNYKDVNNIYLNTIANGIDSTGNFIDTASAAQLDTLLYIASQCPLSRRRGVIEARFMIDAFYHTIILYKDSCVDSLLFDVRYISSVNNKKSNPKNIANVEPNPANTLLNIEVQLQTCNTAIICLYNSIGEKVRCVALTNGLTTMPVIELASGIYYYRITDVNNSLIKGDKIMILH